MTSHILESKWARHLKKYPNGKHIKIDYHKGECDICYAITMNKKRWLMGSFVSLCNDCAASIEYERAAVDKYIDK